MASIACPHCQAPVYSWWDKYLAGKWAILICPQCGGRACAQPLIMIALYFFYMWDVVLFGFLIYLEGLFYLAVLVVGWLILDYFSVYLPLSPLNAKPADGAGR